jgi:antitoxin component YwqK of YwqJK toxin-antitoxin module
MKPVVLATTVLFILVSPEAFPDRLIDTGYIPGVGPMPARVIPALPRTEGTDNSVAGADSPGSTLGADGSAIGESQAVSDVGNATDGGKAPDARPALSKDGPQPVARGKTYARAETSGVVIAGEKTWYLEEFDALERPSVGTTWVDGAVAKTVSWKYHGETQTVRERLESDGKGTTLSEYDQSGRMIAQVAKDADGKELSSTKNEYSEGGRLSETVSREGSRVKRTTFVYAEDGSLLERRGYLDGALEIVCRWKDEDNWTETVYNKGKAALVVTYVDGVRRKETDAKKK